MDLNEARKRLPELAGLSDESALNVIHQVYYPNMDRAALADRLGFKAAPPPVPERSMARAAGDLGLQFAGGAVSGVRMMSDLFGADNAVSGGLRGAEDALRELQSAAAKADQQRIAEIMKEAESKGFGDQVIAGVKAFGQAPAAMIAQALGTSIPTLATALIPGIGQGAVAARLGAGAAIGAAQGAGNIKSVIYDEVMQKPLAGETPEQTKARAEAAQAYGGENTGQIALGGVLGAAAGSTGMERALSGLRNGVTQAAPGMVARVGMGVAAEAVPEIAQGGQEKLAGNLALRNEGFDVEPMAGVVAGATMEGLAGGLTGGVTAIPRPAVIGEREPVPQPVPVPPVEPPGPMTKAVNALGPRLTNTLTADLLGRNTDPLAGQVTADRQASEDAALTRQNFADRNGAMLAGGGLDGSRADPLANMLADARTSEANSFTNVQQAANRRPPMPASDAARILDEAKSRGMDLTAAPHPDGGFVVVPRQWVTPDMAAQAETEIADTLARMQQADAAPVERAERRRSEPVDLNLNTDPVAGYIEDLRKTNTPAARAYVGEFDAGRVTRADVEQRMQNDRGLTADERLARAAEDGLKLNPKNEPFKTLMAANLAAKTTPGTVIEVPGGYAIRPQESTLANTAAQEVPEADAAPVQADPPAAAVSFADAGNEAGGTAVRGSDEQGAVEALSNEQDAPQATTGAAVTTEAPTTGAETPAVEEAAPARGDGAAAAGVPDAGRGTDVQADGVRPASKKDAKAIFGGRALNERERAVPLNEKALDEFAASGKQAEFDALLEMRKADKSSLTEEQEGRFFDLRTERNQAVAAANNAALGRVGRNPTDLSKNPQKLNTSAEPAQKTAESEQVEPFEHAGLKVRQTRTKVGNEVVDGWLIQSPENAEREAHGERQIGGDRIVETREQAIKTAEQEAKRYAQEKADRAEMDAQDKARRDADEAKKEANRGKTLLERRADAILDKPGKFPASAGLGLGSKREAMDKAIEQGRLVTEAMVDDTAAKKRDRDAVDAVRIAGYILGASNENIPVVKKGLEAQARLKEGKYQKPEYRVYQGSDRNGSFFEITKTEYDYVQKVKANQTAESKPDQEAAQAADDAEPLADATAKPAAPAQQEAQQASDDRDTFTLKRLNRETNKMEPVTFKRGEYIRHRIGDKDNFGEIDGISQARREFSVDGLWYAMGFANKAERPAAPVRKDMAPLSKVIDKVNAKNGEGLTDADRVPPKGWEHAVGVKFIGAVEAEVARLNAAGDGSEYREFGASIIKRKSTSEVPSSKPAQPASKTPTVDRHEALMKSVCEGKATAEQFKAAFESIVSSKDAVIAELETKTKAELLKAGGYFIQMRYASEKKGEVIDAIYRQMVGNFVLGETLSYGMGKGAFEAAVRRHVEATDDAKLEQYSKDRQAAIAEAQAERAAKAAAMDNPQTLADFKAIIAKHIGEGKSAKEAFLSLTPEQRIQFDTLAAESTREAREARKRERKTEVRAAGQTTGGEIIATKHTRDNYDLFVVKLADRLSKEDYSTVLASAKKLGGWYSAFRGNGAIPGFQFKDKANAEAFLKLAGGDTADAQAQAEQRRDAFEDDRSETAVERLRTMADKLADQAAEIENADRKTNTARRARFAASALNGAAEMKAKASTMRNIAQAIEAGGAKFLDAVRTKSQVDMLTGIVATAKYNELREKYPAYADQEKRRGEPATAETADFAEFPTFTAYRSDLASLGRQLLEVDGTKKLGQRIMAVADDVSDAYVEFAKQPANLFNLSRFSFKRGDKAETAIFASRELAETAIKRSGLTGKAIVLAEKRGVNRIILSPSEAINAGIWTGDGDKRITLSTEFGNELVEAIGRRGNKSNKLTVPWQFQNAYDRRKALSRMGIETASEYRSALREFIGLQERAIANKVREMELQMVGRKADGLDFFPTPAEIADQMVEAADIEAGMLVLEPSGGMAHIADRIRAAGAEPDVGEISEDRRELLQEKGYNLVARDFMEFTAPAERGFTFGDLMRAPDGTVGILRGQGGMGSDRVRLVSDDAEPRELGKLNFSELEGVERRGTDSGYDRIIMNPPFSNRRDAEHVQHAYTLLKPGGRIVAIMGEGVFFGQDKKAQDFRDWLESVGGTSEKLPPGSFMDPSLPVNTGVSARMVVIDKPAGDVKYSIDDSTGPADTSDYGPATRIELTDGQRAAVDRLQSVIRRKDGNAGYVLEPVEQVAGAGREFAFASDIIRETFGIEVTPVRQPGKRIFNGAQVGDHLLLDVNTQKPAMAVMGHELLHQLRRDDPQLYSFLKIQIERILKDGAANAYANKLRARYEALGLDALNDDTSMEELLADIVGDQFGQRGLWDTMAKKNFRRMVNLARKVLAFFDKVLATGRDKFPFETDQYLTDIEAAREIVADVLAEYSGDKVGRGGDGDVKLSAAEKQDQTQTPAFKKWFAGSKVVDANGKPLRVYHGTDWPRAINAFKLRQEKVGVKAAYFTPDPAVASAYATRMGTTDYNTAPNVVPVYLSLQNPLEVDGEGRGWGFVNDRALEAAKAGKHDGIIIRNVIDAASRDTAYPSTVYIAFRPEQIKSATGNNGDFDPDNADIRFSVADDIKKAYADRVPDAVRDRIEDLTTSQRGFNRWWHGTVGTQLHKAKVNKEFGRVYSAVQDFMKDVSRMATLAADQAPDLLPQIDNLADVKKVLPQMGIAGSRQRKADMKAASDALFDGTLRYTRDAYGEPVEAQNESDAGLVWTDAELKARGLNDMAIKLYRQARAAIEQSLENLMAADVYRMLTAATPDALANTPAEHAAIMAKVRKAAASDRPMQVLQIAGRALDQQADVLRKQLATLKKEMDEDYADGMTSAYTLAKDALKKIEDIKARMDEKSERVSQLKAEGYAPLMRFGRYAVDVLDADGNRAFFGLYESQYEANRAARRFSEQGLRVSQSVKSSKEFEMLKGISPETAMLFADLLGVEKDAAMQKWLQTALAEQSALKRHIRRKGIAGFDDDAGRVVAAFLTSNSRAASRALHGLRIQESVENVRSGDVKDEAIKLADYVNNPQEEAQAIRSLLFINYIGGSVASALVNLTQTVVQTFPYLAQYGGARKGASRVTAAMKLAMGKIEDAELADAVKRAEADGVIKPQEVFQLQAEASRTLGSDIRVRAALSLWGSFFQMAEQFNRRVAFIAAYQTAKQEGIRNPFAFAENAVDETQGTFNKGNRPNWSRGAIGATLFTFKTFTIQYVEFLKRLPPKERVLALGVLILLAGFRGLPFAEDAEDIIDTAAQAMGYNFTTKAQMDQFLVSALGQPFADFLQHGASGAGMLPFDVSQRLGMADLLPATGVLKASETRKDDQILEVFGVAGSFVRDTLKGQVAPVAIRNAAKGIEMYDRGIYTDTGGRKVIDVGPVDAAMKAIGLQPAVVADESRKAGSVYEMRALFTKVKGEISEQMALGQFENDPAKVQKARDRLADWNEKNPNAQIRLNGQAIRRRVTEMRKDRSERLLKTTPRELRAQAADALE